MHVFFLSFVCSCRALSIGISRVLWLSRRKNESSWCFWLLPFLIAFARFSNENISNNAFVYFIRLVSHINQYFFCQNWFFLCTCSSVIYEFFGAVTRAWSKGLVINLPRRRSLKRHGTDLAQSQCVELSCSSRSFLSVSPRFPLIPSSFPVIRKSGQTK